MKRISAALGVLGAAFLICGCAGKLRRENAELRAKLSICQAGFDGLNEDYTHCRKERAALLDVYKDAGKRLKEQGLLDK